MALANIKKKYVTVARQHARDNSNARKNGESIFYKRYGKRYHLIAVYVTQKQRAMRDLFAEAVRMAKEDMTKWNRVRHWSRQARKHHIIGAYRAAVSFYYKLIKKQGNDIKEMKREESMLQDIRVFRKENIFFWVKFDGDVGCGEGILRLAG